MPIRHTRAGRMRVVRRRGRALLEMLAADRHSGVPIRALCAHAAASVDEFSTILEDDLASATRSCPGEELEWLRREYAGILGEFAAAVRDAIPDREARHGLAQAIQCAILRHERRLREIGVPGVHKIEVRLR